MSASEPSPRIGAGRYAPSPSGDLHFGNLRTALLAWLFARGAGRAFYLRVEDIDTQRSSPESAQRQIDDLLALGLDFDGPVIHQSDRFPAYEQALEQLTAQGRVYECYCSRREIREAAAAPHVAPGNYPGTCRNLTDGQREERREALAQEGRVPALRLRADVNEWAVHDLLHGECTDTVDDFVLRRGGRADQGRDWAYNLAVVVDDGYQGVDQVVRGDDLLSSAPRQAYLAHLLGIPVPEYVHVPLVLNAQGQRLAKRDGAVTLREMLADAEAPQVLGRLAASIGVPGASGAAEVLDRFDPAALPREPFVWGSD